MMSRKSGREGRMERENKKARRERECVCVFLSEREETDRNLLFKSLYESKTKLCINKNLRFVNMIYTMK